MKNFVYSVVGLLLSGCAFAPSVNVFGAAFPDWLFCIVGAILATIVVHVVLSKRHSIAWLHPLSLSYPSLTTLFALLFWLGFFSH
jgi:NADH:ubiquinone oxidoreductase subunit 6 (subunit J)